VDRVKALLVDTRNAFIVAAFYTAEYLFDIRASNRDAAAEAAGAAAPSDRAVSLDGLHNAPSLHLMMCRQECFLVPWSVTAVSRHSCLALVRQECASE
jgi:hypothetical protein